MAVQSSTCNIGKQHDRRKWLNFFLIEALNYSKTIILLKVHSKLDLTRPYNMVSGVGLFPIASTSFIKFFFSFEDMLKFGQFSDTSSPTASNKTAIYSFSVRFSSPLAIIWFSQFLDMAGNYYRMVWNC